VFRLDKDEAIINRYGFNSDGMVAVLRNLRTFENRRCDYNPGLLGINVGECVL
jgi:dihydroorotate dehydrogenase